MSENQDRKTKRETESRRETREERGDEIKRKEGISWISRDFVVYSMQQVCAIYFYYSWRQRNPPNSLNVRHRDRLQVMDYGSFIVQIWITLFAWNQTTEKKCFLRAWCPETTEDMAWRLSWHISTVWHYQILHVSRIRVRSSSSLAQSRFPW